MPPGEAPPLPEVVELLATRHGLTPLQARLRLEGIAEAVGISDQELAELILRFEVRTARRTAV
jgi:hypothetical protein